MIIKHLDVDECLQNSNDCDANANCTNTEGSYTCECLGGYTGNGRNCSGIAKGLNRKSWWNLKNLKFLLSILAFHVFPCRYR